MAAGADADLGHAVEPGALMVAAIRAARIVVRLGGLVVEIVLLAPGQRSLVRRRRAIAVVAGREAEQKATGESEERGAKPT